MSFFNDLSNSFIKTFTDPAHANFGDFATVIGSLGGTAAFGAGMSSLIGGSGTAGAGAGAGIGTTGGAASLGSLTATGGLSANGLLASEFGYLGTSTGAGIAGLGTSSVAGGVLAAGQAGLAVETGFATAPILAPAVGGGFWSSLGSALTSTATTTGKLIVGAATLSTAAASILAPWQKVAGAAGNLIFGGGGSGQPVLMGGVAAPAGYPAERAAQAVRNNWPVILGAVAVVGLGAWWYVKRRRKS